MSNISRTQLTASLLIIFSVGLIQARYAIGQPTISTDNNSETSIQYQGYEAVLGVTFRAQALRVSEGRSDKRLGLMIGNFEPSPYLHVTTPIHVLGEEIVNGVKVSHHGYYGKFMYNRFSLDRQDDAVNGGIGSGSGHDYGTHVEGEFLAATSIAAIEMLRPDGTVPFRMELGLGVGYLSLSGDIFLGDILPSDDIPNHLWAVRTDIDYSGPAFFIFCGGQHHWKSWLFGYELGAMVTSSTPYSFNNGYFTLDFGYRKLF